MFVNFATFHTVIIIIGAEVVFAITEIIAECIVFKMFAGKVDEVKPNV